MFALALLAAAAAAAAAVATGAAARVTVFTPLDPATTDPATLFRAVDNPVPVDYVRAPRFPIVPSPGPMATDVLRAAYAGERALPTGVWTKNLWGFALNDSVNWNGVYAYPYVASFKNDSVALMYPGRPNGTANSRMQYGFVGPGDDANVTDAGYPYLTMGAAFDFGLTLTDGVGGAPLAGALRQPPGALGFRFQYGSDAAVVVHKGALFVTAECRSACGVHFRGSARGGVPPIIALNGAAPGARVTASAFEMRVAVGPSHPEGEFWHVYFAHDVTIELRPEGQAVLVGAPYTGAFQVGCGERGNAARPLLDKYAGTYAASAALQFDVDETSAAISYAYETKTLGAGGAGVGGAAAPPLAMLALPHHRRLLRGRASLAAASPFWCTKGSMYVVEGARWTLDHALSSATFGDEPLPSSLPPAQRAALDAQVTVDVGVMTARQCPGFNVSGHGLAGSWNMELYAYARDLATYVDVAAAAAALGRAADADRLTSLVARCAAPLLAMQDAAPQPCEPPINRTLTCARDVVGVYYDRTWGGVVTGWYNRFAEHYCEGCDNAQGYTALGNYGNAVYSSHLYQYGYVIKVLAWLLHRAKTPRTGSDAAEVAAAAAAAAAVTSAVSVDEVRVKALAYARDIANPDDAADPYFTAARHKDFFDGHSWSEGYSYSGRIQTWNNEQAGGEAANGYYAVSLLGRALGDANVRDWGRVLLAMEVASVREYQQLDNVTRPNEPYERITAQLRCLPLLIGNGLTGATFYGPQALFQCGITLLPITPLSAELIDSAWAADAYRWLMHKVRQNGFCRYPDPLRDEKNPCPAVDQPATSFANAYRCCGLDRGWPDNLWRAFPDWLPYAYMLLSFNDTAAALQALHIDDVHAPTDALPFPYLNAANEVVGYHPSLSRTAALHSIAMRTTTAATAAAAAAAAAAGTRTAAAAADTVAASAELPPIARRGRVRVN